MSGIVMLNNCMYIFIMLELLLFYSTTAQMKLPLCYLIFGVLSLRPLLCYSATLNNIVRVIMQLSLNHLFSSFLMPSIGFPMLS
jgi:hypothetical protein